MCYYRYHYYSQCAHEELYCFNFCGQAMDLASPAATTVTATSAEEATKRAPPSSAAPDATSFNNASIRPISAAGSTRTTQNHSKDIHQHPSFSHYSSPSAAVDQTQDKSALSLRAFSVTTKAFRHRLPSIKPSAPPNSPLMSTTPLSPIPANISRRTIDGGSAGREPEQFDEVFGYDPDFNPRRTLYGRGHSYYASIEAELDALKQQVRRLRSNERHQSGALSDAGSIHVGSEPTDDPSSSEPEAGQACGSAAARLQKIHERNHKSSPVHDRSQADDLRPLSLDAFPALGHTPRQVYLDESSPAFSLPLQSSTIASYARIAKQGENESAEHNAGTTLVATTKSLSKVRKTTQKLNVGDAQIDADRSLFHSESSKDDHPVAQIVPLPRSADRRRRKGLPSDWRGHVDLQASPTSREAALQEAFLSQPRSPRHSVRLRSIGVHAGKSQTLRAPKPGQGHSIETQNASLRRSPMSQAQTPRLLTRAKSQSNLGTPTRAPHFASPTAASQQRSNVSPKTMRISKVKEQAEQSHMSAPLATRKQLRRQLRIVVPSKEASSSRINSPTTPSRIPKSTQIFNASPKPHKLDSFSDMPKGLSWTVLDSISSRTSSTDAVHLFDQENRPPPKDLAMEQSSETESIHDDAGIRTLMSERSTSHSSDRTVRGSLETQRTTSAANPTSRRESASIADGSGSRASLLCSQPGSMAASSRLLDASGKPAADLTQHYNVDDEYHIDDASNRRATSLYSNSVDSKISGGTTRPSTTDRDNEAEEQPNLDTQRPFVSPSDDPAVLAVGPSRSIDSYITLKSDNQSAQSSRFSSLRAIAPVFTPCQINSATESQAADEKNLKMKLGYHETEHAHLVPSPPLPVSMIASHSPSWVPFSKWHSLLPGEREVLKQQRRLRGSSEASSAGLSGSTLSAPHAISPLFSNDSDMTMSPTNVMHYGTLASPGGNSMSELDCERQEHRKGWGIGSAAPGWWYGWRGGDGREISFVGHSPDAERWPDAPINFHNYKTGVNVQGQPSPLGGNSSPEQRTPGRFQRQGSFNKTHTTPTAPRKMREWAAKLGYPLVPCGDYEITSAIEHVGTDYTRRHVDGWCHDCVPAH